MHNDKMIEFVKRWKNLQQRQADLDYEKAVLARDIRAEFKAGHLGDEQFVGWCDLELGMLPRQAHELLARADMLKSVPDQRQWKKLGGFAALKCIAMLPEPQRKQVVVQALGAGSDLRVVLRERGLLPPSDKPTYKTDAERLAEYAATLPNLPKYIRDIVAKYVQKNDKQAA